MKSPLPSLAVVFLSVALLLAQGCATPNPYHKYFNDNRALMPSATMAMVEAPSAPARLVRLPIFNKVIFDAVGKKGYIQLGMSNFGGAGRVTEAMLLEQAKDIGASIVYYGDSFSHTTQGVAPVLNHIPGNTVTTQSNGSASLYGSQGQAFGTFGATSQTITPGRLETSYVPTTLTHTKYWAYFYASKKPEFLTKEELAAR